MATVTIQYFGMDGSGKTVTEAKRDAGAKIEQALAGHYNPYAMLHNGCVGIIARSPTAGWGYKIIWQDSKSDALYLGGRHGCEFKQAQRDCAHHLATSSGNYIGLERYLDKHDIRDLDRYFEWQAIYAEVKNAGGNDDQARASADMSR